MNKLALAPTRRDLCLAALAAGVASAARADAARADAARVDDGGLMPRGAPHGRIGGATRGLQPLTAGLNLQLVAPARRRADAVLDPAPTLFFITARGTDLPVRFAVASRSQAAPVVMRMLPRIAHGGLHRIPVADFGVALPVDQVLIWSVSILVDETDPSADLVAVGLIRHRPAPAALAARLAEAGDTQRIAALVRAGFWYDAVSEAARDPGGRPILTKLLTSQGLTVPA